MTDLENRLNTAERRRDWPNQKPRDAATLIIVDDKDARTPRDMRLLMGRRHMRHKFMPGKFVFPGGRVDPADSRAPCCDHLDPQMEAKLLTAVGTRTTAARVRALAMAAVRETYEETGILIGEKVAKPRSSRNAEWNDYLRHGVLPRVRPMRFIARAITPPRRPRRFDTRFLAIRADQIAKSSGTGPSGELEDIHWVPLGEASDLDLPTITHVILEELQTRLEKGGFDDATMPVPFYAWKSGRFNRIEI